MSCLTTCNYAPSHRCKVCGALWIQWNDGTWSLYSPTCGPCCDNVAMGEQIEPLADEPVVVDGGKDADSYKLNPVTMRA